MRVTHWEVQPICPSGPLAPPPLVQEHFALMTQREQMREMGVPTWFLLTHAWTLDFPQWRGGFVIIYGRLPLGSELGLGGWVKIVNWVMCECFERLGCFPMSNCSGCHVRAAELGISQARACVCVCAHLSVSAGSRINNTLVFQSEQHLLKMSTGSNLHPKCNLINIQGLLKTKTVH